MGLKNTEKGLQGHLISIVLSRWGKRRLEKNKGKKKIKKWYHQKKPTHPTRPVPLTMLQMGVRRQNLDKCQTVLLPFTQYTETSVLKSQPHATSGEELKSQVITYDHIPSTTAGVAGIGLRG